MPPTEEKKPNNIPKTLKWGLSALLACVAAALLYTFPPFRIVPLDVANQQKESETFDPKAFAENFWINDLMNSQHRAVDAITLFAAIEADPKEAKQKYSRTWGIGGVYYYYFVSGVGRVVSKHADSVGLSLGSHDSSIAISIATANIFGNAIRDGTGLIDPSDFPNSQDLNNISLRINRIVEDRVLPPFRETVVVGSRVSFLGCAEIMDEDTDLRPMRIIPIVLEVQ